VVGLTVTQSSAVKTWYNSDGLSTSVETPNIARARNLQEMYNVLLNDFFDQDERIDILMTVKNTVKVFHLLVAWLVKICHFFALFCVFFSEVFFLPQNG